MNKNDVLKIIEVVASDPFFKDFVIRKSDNSIIYKTKAGYKRVVFQYYNGYDLLRDDLALEIHPNYDVRFNVLHKWFEKYSKKTLTDQRDQYSIGVSGNMIGATYEFCFLENRKDYQKDLQKLQFEVVKNANYFFNKISTLVDYYNYCVVNLIKGDQDLPYGFDWIPNYLIATRIVSPDNYNIVKKLILQRVELMKNGNPNIKMYYNELPTILDDLENTDFMSGKWGEIV